MNKLVFFLVLSLISCKKSLYNSKKGVSSEKYIYYKENFVLPEHSQLKSNGVYVSISEELLDYKVANYKKNYPERQHPALKGQVPIKDTIIPFNRYFYCQFNDNGKWKQSGGFYSLKDLISDVKKMDENQKYDIYKIENDSLFLESYNWYQKKFTYREGIIISDTIFLKDKKNKKDGNTVKYIYHPVEY